MRAPQQPVSDARKARPGAPRPLRPRASRAARGETLDLPDAEIRYRPDFLSRRRADHLFEALRTGIEWSQHRVRLFGREHPSPRLSAWYGDPTAVYRYSGQTLEPLPWTPTLVALCARVGQCCGQPFDGVLLNLYRDGRDGMGWHSDDERELGPAPCIASVSLGAPRRGTLKLRLRKGVPPRSLVLEHGSLLTMRGETQRHWRHAIPKTQRAVGARINLTFRSLATSGLTDRMGEERAV